MRGPLRVRSYTAGHLPRLVGGEAFALNGQDEHVETYIGEEVRYQALCFYGPVLSMLSEELNLPLQAIEFTRSVFALTTTELDLLDCMASGRDTFVAESVGGHGADRGHEPFSPRTRFSGARRGEPDGLP